MLNVNIKYNPYFVTTIIEIDGEKISDNSELAGLTVNARIQDWIDRAIPIFCEKREDVTIHFKGTSFDGEDVKSAVEDFLKKDSKTKVHVELDVSSETDESKVKRLYELFDESKKGPFAAEFNSEKMESSFKSTLDPTFEINVIATMSSGKSTVVNALLGSELMPEKNEACTATIARIEDDDSMPAFTAQRFDKSGKAMSGIETATKELLGKWNADKETSLIQVKGNIPTVNQTDSCKMVFIDTPGPNNSMNDNHQKITLEAIKDKPLSMILYVLNATQLCTHDDKWLLNQVRDAMSIGGRKAHDRFIFIINKIDELDSQKGESVTKTLNNVKEYLEENGIKNPLVIPSSAKLTKLIRLDKNPDKNKFTLKEKNFLKDNLEHFTEEPEMNALDHARDRLNSESMRKLDKKLKEAQEQNKREDVAEILSGIPIVEELLNNFLKKHAMPAKLKDAVGIFECVIAESKMAEKMNQQLMQSEEELNKAVARVDSFMKDESRILKAKEFRDKVKGLKYKLSRNATNVCGENHLRSERIIDDLRSKIFHEEINLKDAETLIRDIKNECQHFEFSIIISLTQELNNEYLTVIKNLRKEYQEFAEEVLNASFPENSSLRELQATVMSMPSEKEMFKYHKTKQIKTGTKTVCTGSYEVSNSRWWNPFTWWSTKTVYEYEEQDIFEEREIVNIREIFEKISKDIRKFSMDSNNKFQEKATEDIEQAKTTLLEMMDIIDCKLSSIQEELVKANCHKEEKALMLEENQSKIDWYRDFKEKLQSILAI